MSASDEAIGELDDVANVGEIQDEKVLDRRCRRKRLRWRDELELGVFVRHTEDDSVEAVMVLERPQDTEADDP